MAKASEVFKKIRFAKLDPKHDKAGPFSTDDEEHGAVSEIEWDQQLKHQKHRSMQEEEQLDEKNVPTSPEKWAQAKSQAKAKFDVYPSAYANGWAAKKYKEMGGGWKSVSESKDMKSMRIIKDIYKRKSVKEEIEIEEEFAGWIAHFNGQKHEIKKHEAKDLYDAKQKAIAHFKAPKSKHGLIAVKPAYNEQVEESRGHKIIDTFFKNRQAAQNQKTDKDKWSDEYKKARAAGSSSANARARANGAVYEEEQVEEGYYKKMATDAEEDKRLGSWKKETPWVKSKGNVTDKSGAVHTPMSRARDLARAAMKKNVKESVSITESRLADIVREAAEKAKKKKKEETKKSDDTFQSEPELSTQIIKND